MLNGFKRLSDAYQKRDEIDEDISEMVKTLQSEFKLLDKYPVELSRDGVSIKRKNRMDIICTEELNEIEHETGTQLIYANDSYYMLAWKFRLSKEE